MRLSDQLKRGSIPALLLTFLREREMYGYELSQELRRRGGEALSVSEGSLYPALHRLEGDGLIAGDWRVSADGRRRRYYTLTLSGRKAAAEAEAELQSFARMLLRTVPEAT